jgi:hypothetical protein
MGATAKIGESTRMASRWRRRRMCLLVCDGASPAALREISATSAFVETNARPALGSRVALHHPEAGAIDGVVSALAPDGLRLAFPVSEQSAAFALAAIVADMSKPA